MDSVRRLMVSPKEPFQAISHWVGMGLAILGTAILLTAADGRLWHTLSFSIYGAALISLYLASAMAHTVRSEGPLADRLTRLDYAAIFLLIAGTYTPLCLLPLRGALGWSLLVFEWCFAAIGSSLVLFRYAKGNALRTTLYLAMAWMCLLALPQMWSSLHRSTMIWLLAGGAVYSLGAVVYVTDRPSLCRVFVAHDLWHVMVLLGSACHFIAIWTLLA